MTNTNDNIYGWYKLFPNVTNGDASKEAKLAINCLHNAGPEQKHAEASTSAAIIDIDIGCGHRVTDGLRHDCCSFGHDSFDASMDFDLCHTTVNQEAEIHEVGNRVMERQCRFFKFLRAREVRAPNRQQCGAICGSPLQPAWESPLHLLSAKPPTCKCKIYHDNDNETRKNQENQQKKECENYPFFDVAFRSTTVTNGAVYAHDEQDHPVHLPWCPY